MKSRLPALAVAGMCVVAAAVATVSPASARAESAAPRVLAGAVSGPAPSRAPAGLATGLGAAPSRPGFLINGDRVIGGSAVPARSGYLAGPVMSVGLGGRRYSVPVAALPYLRRGLDPGLFETGGLLARETGGRLPVVVRYRGRVPALPGVAITGSGGGTARGYLTASSSAAFGAALDRQAAADRVRGSYGADGMFAGGVSIALAGSAPAPAARPDYPMHTLMVTATNLAGGPDTGDYVLLVDVDNTTLVDPITAVNVFYHGVAKYSVPAGHYYALGVFGNSQEPLAPIRVVVLPQFSVARATTVAMREAAAASQVTMVTPRPATAASTDFYLARTGTRGPLFYTEFSVNGHALWVSPDASRPSTGTLQAYANQVLASPAGAKAVPYSYELSYTDPPGVIPAQRYQVRAESLATVHENYYQSAGSPGSWGMFGGFATNDQDTAFLGFVEAYSVPLSLPGRLIVYAGGTGSARIMWASDYASDDGDYLGSEADRLLPAGRQLTDNWGAYPLHPAPNSKLYLPNTVIGQTPVSAAREGNTLWLDVTPFSDSQPGHLGPGLLPVPGVHMTGSYQVDENGRLVAAGNAVTAAARTPGDVPVQATLGADPGTVRFELATSRTGPKFSLSTFSQTVWTWHSASVSGARLPAGWFCASVALAPTLSPDCAVQPMMTLDYDVARLGLDGVAPAGRQVLGLDVGHIQLAGNAKITGAGVCVSFDGGRTWRRALVTRSGAGSFRAVFSAPAGALVTLRTRASDAAGGSITETITGAYRIAPRAATAARVLRPATSALRAACPPAPRGDARCFALFAPQSEVNAAIAAGVNGAAAVPAGWGATDIESAYKLPVSRDPDQTVAVVDAYQTPGLAADLAVYRRQYGLPACSTASGCLRIVNQAGHTAPLPSSGVPYGWDVETMLDVSMVSAACPHCKILVVEARSAGFADLAAAENTAARLGAQVISNSYGARETGLTQAYASAYSHPGHVIVVASGDLGFTAANFPANLATVTAAGGTELARADNQRGWSEQVWDTSEIGASGSGCSAYVAKPSWQHDPHCPGRTVADVSALAWNIPVYDQWQGGWLVAGGTSAAAPLIAGVYALAGNAATIKPGYEYSHASSLFDITVGNNDLLNDTKGATCGFDYLCTAKKGYDAPTGLGTPDGTGAF